MTLSSSVPTEVRSGERIDTGATISVSINLLGVVVIVENFNFTAERRERSKE